MTDICCPFCGTDTPESQNRIVLTSVHGWPQESVDRLSGVKLTATACLASLVEFGGLQRIRYRMRQLIDTGKFYYDPAKMA